MDIIGTLKIIYRTIGRFFYVTFSSCHAPALHPVSAGAVLKIIRTRIGQRRGATRARVEVVRQGGGRILSLAVPRTIYAVTGHVGS